MPSRSTGRLGSSPSGMDPSVGAHSVHQVQRSPWRTCPTIHWRRGFCRSRAFTSRGNVVGSLRNWAYQVERGRRHCRSRPSCPPMNQAPSASEAGRLHGASAAAQSTAEARSTPRCWASVQRAVTRDRWTLCSFHAHVFVTLRRPSPSGAYRPSRAPWAGSRSNPRWRD